MPSALPSRLDAATPVHSPRSLGSAQLTQGFALCRIPRAGRALHRGIHPHPVFALARGDKTKEGSQIRLRPSGPAGRRLLLVLSPRPRGRFDGVPPPVRGGSRAAHPPLVALGRSSFRVCLRRLGVAARPTRWGASACPSGPARPSSRKPALGTASAFLGPRLAPPENARPRSLVAWWRSAMVIAYQSESAPALDLLLTFLFLALSDFS